MKRDRGAATVLIAAVASLLAALMLVTSLAAAQTSKGGSEQVQPKPDDITHPIREGFESGSLNASAFRSAVPTCVPGGCGWSVVATDKHIGTYSAFAPDVSNVADQQLVLSDRTYIPAGVTAVTLSFWQRYGFEVSGANYYDGGVLEVSTDNGGTWSDSQVQFATGGYNSTIHAGGNPLAGRQAWGGSTGGAFVHVQASLLGYAGHSMLIRFREGTDTSNGGDGWWVDDIELTVTSATPCGTASWFMVQSYPVGVGYPAAVAHNGLLYMFGGIDNTGHPTALAYKYNPLYDSWSPIASLPEARTGAAAVSDGTYIYVLGGNDPGFNRTGTLWRYDPVADSYTPLTSYADHTWIHAAAYLNGKIYRVGGLGDSGAVDTVEVYTIASNTWAPGPAYPHTIAGLNLLTYGNYIYAAGGTDNATASFNKTYRFNPANGIWDDAAITDMPEIRAYAAGDLLNGRWVLVGGFTGGSNYNSVVAWDPVSNTWSALPDTLNGEFDSGAGTIGQSLYVVAGQDTQNNRNVFNRRYTEVPCTTFTPTPAPPTPTPPTCAMNFTDVHTTDYFYNDVHTLFCLGAISGYADGTFRPFNNTTRGQLSKIIVLAEGWPLQNPQNPTFSDVLPGSAFYQYVETAVSHSVISGYADGTFRPNNNVTRGQLAKIIVLAEGWPLENPQNPTFSDVAYGSAFYQFVETAHSHNVISGYADGTFRPGNSATRSQICKIVAQAISQP